MTDIVADALSNNLGIHLLHWALSQSDIWYLAHRCADLVQKIHEPLERGAAVLDNILTLEEESIEEDEQIISINHHTYDFSSNVQQQQQEMNQQQPLQRLNNHVGK